MKKGESKEDLGDLRQRMIPAAGMSADTRNTAKSSHGRMSGNVDQQLNVLGDFRGVEVNSGVSQSGDDDT